MLRDSDIISIATQEGVDPDELFAVYKLESSSGTNPKGAKEAFGVKRAAFQDMMGGQGDITNERDQAIAAARYLKLAESKGWKDEGKGAFYNQGPSWLPRFEALMKKGQDLVDGLGTPVHVYGKNFVAAREESRKKRGAAQGTTMEDEPTTSALYDSLTGTAGFSTDSSGAPPAMPGDPSIGATSPDQSAGTSPSRSRSPYETLRNEITAAAQAALGKISGAESVDKTIAEQYTEAVKTLTDSLTGAAKAKSIKILADAQVETTLGLEANTVLSQLGINTSDINSMAAQIATRMARNAAASNALQNQINEKLQKNIFEDPMGWVNAQITLPQDVATHNALVQEFQADGAKAGTLSQVANAFTVANQSKKGMYAGQAALSAAEAVLEESKGNVAKVNMDASRFSWEIANSGINRAVQKLQLYEGMYRVLESGDTKEQQMQAKEAKVASEQAAFNVQKLAAADLGIDLQSPAQFAAMTKDQKAAIEMVANTGGVGGATTMEAYTIARMGNPAKMPPRTRELAELVGGSFNETRGKVLANPVTSNYNKEEVAAAQNVEVYREFEKAQANTSQPLRGRPNIYAAQTPLEMIKDIQVSDTRLATIIRSAAQAAPALPLNDQSVVALAIEDSKNEAALAAAEGRGNRYNMQAVAKDLQLYFARAAKINNSNYNFDAWKLPQQTVYGFEVEPGVRIDGMKYDSVLAFLVRKQARDNMFTIPGNMPMGIVPPTAGSGQTSTFGNLQEGQ